jgi:Carboxypeptidase regulatory-like domain
MVARRYVRMFIIGLLVLFARTLPAEAQLTTGTVSGTVKDAQGGVIPGATVTLISEARGTMSQPAVTNAAGDFVFPNITADTYTIQVEMSSFKTLKRSGVSVSPGSRVSVGELMIELGGRNEVIDVKGEAPVIQAASGERSFTITTETVQNLPVANRSFTALAAFVPGVNGTSRLGGGGATNLLVDSVNVVDTGSNGTGLNLNTEAVGEVKVLTSNYQAEYGRSSGLQITAVTKSGTNRYRGSVYDIQRDSSWNANSWVNKKNGAALAVDKQKDWGYAIGGPVGKPGGHNKLFFFYSQEWRPRSGSGSINRFRVPTAAERQGDFSQSRDNNGNLFPYIKDPNLNGTCSAASQVACFADGGVVGKIPQNRLYGLGLNILNLWPLPNDSAGYAATNSYNFVNSASPVASHQDQDATRVDYQVSQKLRATWKLVEQNATRLPNQAGLAFGQGGSLLNGFNDATETQPRIFQTSATVNYNLSATTFLEATWGEFQNYIGTVTITPNSNKNNVGLSALPMLFPDAGVVDPQFYSYGRLNQDAPPWWDGTRSLMLPNFNWGNRIANAPPNMRDYGCCLNVNRTQDVAVSLTKVMGRHTAKAGYYFQYSWKAQTAGVGAATPYNGNINFQNDTNNPLDTGFGFANAALGIFSAYGQQSRFLEGGYKYVNNEFYLQDNWKVNRKFTLDYGLRFVGQQPQYESYGLASNFLPDKYSLANATVLYRPVCAPGVASPCSGQNIRSLNPVTGEIGPAGSSTAVGQLVPGVGSLTNGIFKAGTDPVPSTNYNWPLLAVAPRFGFAYDLTGTQKLVLRGGGGLFYDRPSGNSIFGQVNNPPASTAAIVNNGQLQTLTQSAALSAPSALTVFQLNTPLPSSTQWNGGMQVALPWSSSLDLEYVGQHGSTC